MFELFSSGEELDSEKSAFISKESESFLTFFFGLLIFIIFTPKFELLSNSLLLNIFKLFILLLIIFLLSLFILSLSFGLLLFSLISELIL